MIEECHQAFKELKKFFGSPPLLSKFEVREDLYLYFAASLEAVSSILIQVDDKGAQSPIYYTNQVLHDTETRYSKAQKIIYALIISA